MCSRSEEVETRTSENYYVIIYICAGYYYVIIYVCAGYYTLLFTSVQVIITL